MNYLMIGKASHLSGKDRKIYRMLEIFPGTLSWLTLILLVFLSYFQPVLVAIFIIVYDIYWLLLVIYYAIYMIAGYKKMNNNMATSWKNKCQELGNRKLKYEDKENKISEIELNYESLYQLIILPTYNESLDIIRPSINSLLSDDYPTSKMIVVLAMEERAGDEARFRADVLKKEFGDKFRNFIVTWHPDGIEGEIKGKGANQRWAAIEVKKNLIDIEKIDYKKILVSVFDIDTIVYPGYFYCLAYNFLIADKPYRSSYQPIPFYHNNLWQAPFFSRAVAFSNTFWQMIQQVRPDKLATYSSHSMTWQALTEVGFWSPNMVSEDSRIFFHCFCYYNGDYNVVPLYYPLSMDICMDKGFFSTAKNLYKQQRRWGWGVESVPYLIFNAYKNWDKIPKKEFIKQIFLIQLYGFHSWATNSLIVFLGFLPLILGGDKFHATSLSSNLPYTTQFLGSLSMIGLVILAILSTLTLPKDNVNTFRKKMAVVVQWVCLPVTIILFGSIPAMEAQTRLILGKYMGFWVTPKER